MLEGTILDSSDRTAVDLQVFQLHAEVQEVFWVNASFDQLADCQGTKWTHSVKICWHWYGSFGFWCTELVKQYIYLINTIYYVLETKLFGVIISSSSTIRFQCWVRISLNEREGLDDSPPRESNAVYGLPTFMKVCKLSSIYRFHHNIFLNF